MYRKIEIINCYLGSAECSGCFFPCDPVPEHHIWTERRDRKAKRKDHKWTCRKSSTHNLKSDFLCEGRDIQHGHQAADGGTEDTTGCNGRQFQRANEASVWSQYLHCSYYSSLHSRHRLMEIDNHILALSMEFEKQNIIVTEWETEKAKHRSDRYANQQTNKLPNHLTRTTGHELG